MSAVTKRSKFYDYLLESGQNVVEHDVDNIVATHRLSVARKDDDDVSQKTISKLAAGDAGALEAVDKTD